MRTQAADSAIVISPEKALRKLYLRLFLRGRSSRGLNKSGAPKSVASKLAMTLVFYGLFGSFVAFARQSVFALSVSLHAATLMFIGMFVASSAGEALFNKEESDILLHRPIEPRSLLWAKVSVMAQIALWLAGTFNLAGFVVGTLISPAKFWFIAAHVISLVLETFFCIGLVVVTYQLCLKWLGRERLDGLLTTAQTLMAMTVVLGSQLAPRYLMQQGTSLNAAMESWWILALPPAWFAGIDDLIAGSGEKSSLALAACGVVTTTAILWIGFGKLAKEYAAGLQVLNENPSTQSKSVRRGAWLERLVKIPPLRWSLRNSVTRGSFVLSVAYMFRDRETKLRVFPGLAPMLVMPIMILLPQGGRANPANGFLIAFAGTYLGLAPLLALNFLKYSQNWQAADIFRSAPVAGPAALCHGARKAVFFALTLPLFVAFVIILVAMGTPLMQLALLLPGLITLPVLSMVPCANGEAVPFSQPSEEAKSAGRGLQMLVVTFVSMGVAGAAALADTFGFLWFFLIGETIVAAIVYAILQRRCAKARWPSID
jgi:ABC-2 type transport system permease protein